MQVAQASFICCRELLGIGSHRVAQISGWNVDTWITKIAQNINDLHSLPLPYHINKERQRTRTQMLVLVHHLHQICGGSSQLRQLDLGYTPLENLMLYCLVCGVETSIPHQFGAPDVETFWQARDLFKVTNGKRIHWRRHSFEYNGLVARLLSEFPVTLARLVCR